MSAEDAQNMYEVNTDLLVQQYRQKLSESEHRGMLLENALGVMSGEKDQLIQQNEALQKQIEALTPADEEVQKAP